MPVKTHPIKVASASKKINRKGRKNMLVTQDIMTPSVSIENQGTNWLTPNEAMIAINNAVRHEIKRKEEQGLPIAKYDIESQKAYLENADGSREYV